MAAVAYVSLGSNMGDRLANLRAARDRLGSTNGLEVLRASAVYETAPWGVEDQPAFLNAVVEVSTVLVPRGLLLACLGIEDAMGRTRAGRWGPRLIDLDVLLYGDEMVCSDELTIPHPLLEERAFVLAPLADLIPDRTLPSGWTVAQALGSVGTATVRRYPEPL